MHSIQHGHRKIIIAIDGYSSCGKSTLARALARRLGYIHIDSGAMYRAVTLYLLRHQVDLHDMAEVEEMLSRISIHLSFEDHQQVTWLNHENVEEAIRQPKISEWVSDVSTLSSVRASMVAQQRKMGANKGIVMDGRDIGTVVFPNADLKLFLTADTEVRVQRRLLELREKGIEINADDVRHNLLLRDQIDSTREDSPLRKADDAITLDTSYLTPKEQLQIALDMARSVIGSIESQV